MIAFSVVLLPTPLRPSRPTTSPAPDLERDAVQDVALAVVGVESSTATAGRDATGVSHHVFEIDLLHARVGLDLVRACPRPGSRRSAAR